MDTLTDFYFLSVHKIRLITQTYTLDLYLDICSVHVGPAYVGRPVPLAEEHVAPVGVHHDGPGPLEVAEQGAPVLLLSSPQHVQRPLSKQSYFIHRQTDNE